jgi:cation diffusion facilitator CzcD-associated flavoprotein CzcO
MNHRVTTNVAIVGAGPYGLSVAANLHGRTEFRIFGPPMHTWRTQMPAGMLLKSEGFASNLSDPQRLLTLRRYCTENDLEYGDLGVPVRLDTFTDYGLAFQKRFVPELEETEVVALDRDDGGFRLALANGETVRAARVVLAVGTTFFGHVPLPLRQLPEELVSHSSRHCDLGGFGGRDVTVVGAGQSALETAALLHEHGAQVRVLVRGPAVRWNPEVVLHRALPQRIRYPGSGLGYGLRSWFYANAPGLFHYFPENRRVHAVKTILGPAGAWWLRYRVLGPVPLLVGHQVRQAEAVGDQVRLQVDGPDGRQVNLRTDHVIAATGYRVDVDRIPFLSDALRSALGRRGPVPRLSRDLESPVPGLYVVGLASAKSFGPVMRFVLGAGFTARRLSNVLARR